MLKSIDNEMDRMTWIDDFAWSWEIGIVAPHPSQSQIIKSSFSRWHALDISNGSEVHIETTVVHSNDD